MDNNIERMIWWLTTTNMGKKPSFEGIREDPLFARRPNCKQDESYEHGEKLNGDASMEIVG
jgi:hypothetical protein